MVKTSADVGRERAPRAPVTWGSDRVRLFMVTMFVEGGSMEFPQVVSQVARGIDEGTRTGMCASQKNLLLQEKKCASYTKEAGI